MVGQNIGKYRVLDRIGRGGMGTVYRAIDETLHREVAIKVLNAELNDPEVAKRFRAEAITVARLSHPGIATIFELFQNDGQWLMVMEFVRGETLERMVERMGALSPQRAAELCMQALAALAHAHSMGVVHRDLKPANIMITETGAIKIMDFGIARVAGTEHLTSAGFMMGTPAYMAPEQVMGQEIDARADLYAMGVVFYRLTTGRLPFKGDTPFAMAQSQVNDPPTPVGMFRADLPPWVEQVVVRSLAKRPDERFQSAIEFHEAFARCLSGLPMVATYNSSAPTELMMTPPRAMPTGAIPRTMASGPFAVPPQAAPPYVTPQPSPGPVSAPLPTPPPPVTGQSGATPFVPAPAPSSSAVPPQAANSGAQAVPLSYDHIPETQLTPVLGTNAAPPSGTGALAAPPSDTGGWTPADVSMAPTMATPSGAMPVVSAPSATGSMAASASGALAAGASGSMAASATGQVAQPSDALPSTLMPSGAVPLGAQPSTGALPSMGTPVAMPSGAFHSEGGALTGSQPAPPSTTGLASPAVGTGPVPGVPDVPAPAAKPPVAAKPAVAAKKSSVGVLVAASVIVIAAGVGVALWIRGRQNLAPVALPDAAAAATVDPAAAPPPPTDPTPTIADGPTSTPTLPPAVTTNQAGPGRAAASPSQPVVEATPADGRAGRSASPTSGSSTATPGTGGRSAAPPTPAVDDTHQAFTDVKVLTVNGKKTDDQDILLSFVGGSISLVAKKGGTAIAAVPYKSIAAATYVRARKPKANTTFPAPPEDLDVGGGLLRSSRHWLVLQTKDAYLILRLEDQNFQRVLQTVEERTGLKVDRPATTDK